MADDSTPEHRFAFGRNWQSFIATITDESIAEVEALLRLLADHVGADPSAAEIARLLRLPGSHNSKGGEWTEVITETATGCRYELDDLREWLEIAGPVLHRKPKANGAGEPEANPVLELAKRQGFHVPVDAEARRRFGYLPEERGLYGSMRVREQIVYFGRLHGLDVGDVFAGDGTPRVRVRVRAAIAKGGRRE